MKHALEQIQYLEDTILDLILNRFSWLKKLLVYVNMRLQRHYENLKWYFLILLVIDYFK